MIDKKWMDNNSGFGEPCPRCIRNLGCIKFERYYFCYPCFIKGIAEIKLKREEEKGKKFKFKKDRQAYLKELEIKEKDIQDKIYFESESKPCYVCKERFIPHKKMLHLAKNIYMCYGCVNPYNISKDFIKMLDNFRKLEEEEWYKHNKRFWWNGMRYTPIEMLNNLDEYMIKK